MNCKNAQSLLSAYLDDELSGREMLDVCSHLSECGECTEELRSIESVKRMLEGTPVPAPSADFEDRLVSRVLATATPAPETKKLSLLALSGIAAASMLATMLLLNSMHRNQPTADAQKDSMPIELMRRDRLHDFSSDPFTSPVVFNEH